jgi:hypothetical protein
MPLLFTRHTNFDATLNQLFSVVWAMTPNLQVLRSALDGGPRGAVQQNGGILLADKCKLGRRPLDEGPRPRRGTMRCFVHGIISEENNNELNQEMKPKKDFMFKLENCFGG